MQLSNDTKKLNKLIRKVGSVLGTALELLELMAKTGMLHMLLNILENLLHPLLQFTLG